MEREGWQAGMCSGMHVNACHPTKDICMWRHVSGLGGMATITTANVNVKPPKCTKMTNQHCSVRVSKPKTERGRNRACRHRYKVGREAGRKEAGKEEG